MLPSLLPKRRQAMFNELGLPLLGAGIFSDLLKGKPTIKRLVGLGQIQDDKEF